MSNLVYLSAPYAGGLKIRLKTGLIQFVKGALTLNLDDEDEAAMHKELMGLMKKRPDLTSNILVLDLEAAEKQAKKVLAETLPGSMTGPVNSDTVKSSLAHKKLAERDEEMARMNTPVADQRAFEEQIDKAGLHLTENAEDQPAVRTEEGDGFIKEEDIKTPDLEEAIEIPSQAGSSGADIIKDAALGGKSLKDMMQRK